LFQIIRDKKKYESHNPLKRRLLKRFAIQIAGKIQKFDPEHILDLGCGSAKGWEMIQQHMAAWRGDYTGADITLANIEAAKARGLARSNFVIMAENDLPFSPRQFDLIMALEVLEHLEKPAAMLTSLSALAPKYIMLSVPNEPWFSLGTLLSGRYLKRFGRDPEHLQYWNVRSFAAFAEQYLEDIRINTCFPFTIICGKPRQACPAVKTENHLFP